MPTCRVSLLVPMNTLFLMESLNIIVVILWYFSDNGGQGDGSGRADGLVQ